MFVIATTPPETSTLSLHDALPISTSQQNACINNLRQIDGGVQQWALETKQASGATVTISHCKPYKNGRAHVNLQSPDHNVSYPVPAIRANPTCTITATAAPHVLP